MSFDLRSITEVPLVVAPMAGGPSSVALVVASCRAGALGSVAAAYLSPAQIADQVARVRAHTDRPFAINLFVPEDAGEVSPARAAAARAVNRPFREKYGLGESEFERRPSVDFDAQFAAVLALRPAVLSFTFGRPAADVLAEARSRGIATCGTATTVDEAERLAHAGVDVLQGSEAGGHRGTFDPEADDTGPSVRDLVRAARARLACPLIAAGGLTSADDVREVRKLGADAAQLGTAFLATREAGTAPTYRARLLAPGPRFTAPTRAFSGRLARGLRNAYAEALEARPDAILPYPMQNTYTRDLRRAAEAAGSAECSSLWCGAGAGDLWTGGAGELIATLTRER